MMKEVVVPGAAWAIFALALSACGSSPPPQTAAASPKACEPKSTEVTITASDSANGDASGQGRPVQVRIYQLKTDARLKIAGFQDIWQNDKATLQGDLLKVDEHTAFPGQSKKVTIEPTPDGVVVGAVALFREPRGNNWFVTFEVPPAPKAEPCPTGPAQLSVWLDRMQIQDGAGQGDVNPEGAGAGNSSASGAPGGEGH
jgi:type VI secretion system protein VasD